MSDNTLLRPSVRTAALLSSLVVLVLGPGTAGVVLVLLTALWLVTRPPRRDVWTIGTGLLLTTALLAAVAYLEARTADLPEAWLGEVGDSYGELIDDLRSAAREGARSFADRDLESAERLAVFHQLQDLSERSRFSHKTVIVLDPYGQAVAWAGEGLLQEPADLPASGIAYQQGYTALTLIAVEPLTGTEGTPWRLVVGRSLANEALPFQPAGVQPAHVRWSPVPADAVPPPGVDRIDVAGAPSIFVEHLAHPARSPDDLIHRLPRVAVAVLALTLLAAALLRLAAHRDPDRAFFPTLRQVPGVPLLAMAAMTAGAASAKVSMPLLGLLALAAGTAVVGLLAERRRSLRTTGGEAAGGIVLLALAGAAAWYQQRFGTADLAAGLGGIGPLVVLRLVGCMTTAGLLAFASRIFARTPKAGGWTVDRPAWLAVVLLLVAGALHDLPAASLPILALAGIAIVRWAGGVDPRHRPQAHATLLLLAALASAVAWETGYREVFRRRLAHDYLPRISPPSFEELNEIHVGIHRFFDQCELRHLMPPAVDALDPQDLAFVMWRDSPLPTRDGISALVVESYDGTATSSFSFGVGLDRGLSWDLRPERWSVPPAEAWHALIDGEAEILLDGQPWGRARYLFVPRPGFRLAVDETGELEAALVRGESRRRAPDGVPRPVSYGLYSRDGRSLASPWDESPPLDPAIFEADHGVVDTPSGACWYWQREAEDGIEVLYLPRLTLRAGLERIGIHALSSLLWLAGVVLLAVMAALPWRVLSQLFRYTVRSYSRRLLLVYTGLLLVPLVALNLVLLRGFEERLRSEQLATGRAALSSARLFLLDYLGGLEPGYDIESHLNRELLEWISGVVQHQVNLYWQSRLYASSQQELFTSGLLPRRIPGDIFSRLTLLGFEMGSRTRTTGEFSYRELYAPLDVFGRQAGLFLSVPLLEQEEEAVRELRTMRQRAIMVTTALFLLLLAVGSRLARSFTTPIMELIRGTQRIAAGATYLDVTPREQELEALAAAIDDMARRIAEGRKQLVLEKQVVERIVTNITSGVVSLDHQRRVLLHNRVAAELLGTEIGVGLDRSLAGRIRLEPVRDFLAAPGGELRQTTVQLHDDEGEIREWTLTWVPIPGSEEPAALLVVEDATEVLRGQRLEAWAEMARIIAHEIKNPLTPIRLSAEHLRQVHDSAPERLDEVFDRCLDNILKQVEELREIASEFSVYSRIPKAELVADDLIATMKELVAAYSGLTSDGVVVEMHTDLDELRLRYDAKLLGRAVRNLLENALRASRGTGGGRVELTVGRRGEQAVIEVADSGPGVAPENLGRIFEPYFSTHETGTGLGLAIVRRIVEEHGGRVEARNRSGGGLGVTVTIPLLEAT